MDSILSGRSEPAPIYRYWQGRYEISAVDSLENLAQDDPDIVILAQPRAMDPADLTDLDAWVRAGGYVIIFTDPELVWPSSLPLGDPRRPLTTGLLSPLLDHWGLELVARGGAGAGDVELQFEDYSVVTRGVGAFERAEATKSSDVRCELSMAGAIARCLINKGRASLVADADFLNARSWPEDSRLAPHKSAASRFVDSLVRNHFNSEASKE